ARNGFPHIDTDAIQEQYEGVVSSSVYARALCDVLEIMEEVVGHVSEERKDWAIGLMETDSKGYELARAMKIYDIYIHI
ncbi:hypothetical protein KIPB_011252, partial [Kipferlia bialata]